MLEYRALFAVSEAAVAIEKFDVTLVSKEKITPGVLHMTFKRCDGKALNFVPGQFITFLLDGPEGQVKRRSYSVATIPGQTDLIEIAISEVKGGIATETLFNLEANKPLHVMGPAGRLILQADDTDKRLVLVGTGTGIAPYRAMLPELSKRCAVGEKVVIIQGVQYRHDVLYGDDFLGFDQQYDNARYIASLSREDLSQAQSHEAKGYVQQQFAQLDLNPEQDVVYLCGNPNMIDEAYAMLTEQGFTNKNVRREKYISSN